MAAWRVLIHAALHNHAGMDKCFGCVSSAPQSQAATLVCPSIPNHWPACTQYGYRAVSKGCPCVFIMFLSHVSDACAPLVWVVWATLVRRCVTCVCCCGFIYVCPVFRHGMLLPIGISRLDLPVVTGSFWPQGTACCDTALLRRRQMCYMCVALVWLWAV